MSPVDMERNQRDALGVGLVPTGDDTMVVAVSGEVDMASAPQLRSALLDDPGAAREGIRLIVVDLTAVGFLASSGLAVLVECTKLWNERGITMRVVADSRVTLRPIEATGLLSVLNVVPDRQSALEG